MASGFHSHAYISTRVLHTNVHTYTILLSKVKNIGKLSIENCL